jgi:hypothetical protein
LGIPNDDYSFRMFIICKGDGYYLMFLVQYEKRWPFGQRFFYAYHAKGRLIGATFSIKLLDEQAYLTSSNSASVTFSAPAVGPPASG